MEPRDGASVAGSRPRSFSAGGSCTGPIRRVRSSNGTSPPGRGRGSLQTASESLPVTPVQFLRQYLRANSRSDAEVVQGNQDRGLRFLPDRRSLAVRSTRNISPGRIGVFFHDFPVGLQNCRASWGDPPPVTRVDSGTVRTTHYLSAEAETVGEGLQTDQVRGLGMRASIDAESDPTAPRDARQFSLSIIVPTKNESGNVRPLLSAIERATQGIRVEVLFVDDSADDTPQVIRDSQSRYAIPVQLIVRPPERRGNGLSGAVVEGLRTAGADWVCVMDGDLQHPPGLVSRLLEQAAQTGSDLVIASRLAPGGDVTGLGPPRRLLSRLLAAIARAALPPELRRISDPLSGFFLLRRSAVDVDRLRPDGFKILLDLLARCPGLTVSEVPFKFGRRHAGKSKASVHEAMRFLRSVVRLRLEMDSAFLQFAAVGATGLFVNSLVLALATERLGIFYLMSVGLATVSSSLWNFALTESWVFRSRLQRQGRWRRLVEFLGMNVAALALRGPLILVLTSWLGIHYLLSNLLSIAVLTLGRFVLSDRLVWRTPSPSKTMPGATRGPHDSYSSFVGIAGRRSELLPALHRYDIHGIVSVVSEAVLPELESFRTLHVAALPTLQIRLGTPPFDRLPSVMGSKVDDRRMLYDEGLLGLGFRAEIASSGSSIEVHASPLLRWSPHVLYTNLVEPILRWAFVEQGYALVHGACLDFGGQAHLITARTDTGKTTTLLQILYRQRRKTDKFAFISDDLTIISADGSVLTFPKPLTISRHTARAVDAKSLTWWQRVALPLQSRVHSRSGRRIAHFLGRTKLPMATINALVQFLVPPPKYHIQTLVPGVRLARRSRLAGMFVIERAASDTNADLDREQAVEVLLRNSEDAFGFPPYDSIKAFLYGSNGRDLRTQERAIVSQALRGLPAIRLSRTDLDWWRQLPALIESAGRRHLQDTARTHSEPPVPDS